MAIYCFSAAPSDKSLQSAYTILDAIYGCRLDKIKSFIDSHIPAGPGQVGKKIFEGWRERERKRERESVCVYVCVCARACVRACVVLMTVA